MTEGIPVVFCHKTEDATHARSLAEKLVRYGINARIDELPDNTLSEQRWAAFGKSLVGARASVLYVTNGVLPKWQKQAVGVIEEHQKANPSFRHIRFVVRRPLLSTKGELLQDPDWTETSMESEEATLSTIINKNLKDNPGIPPIPMEASEGHGPVRADASHTGSGTTTASEGHGPAEPGVLDTQGSAAQATLDASDSDELPTTGAIEAKYESRPTAELGPSLWRKWFSPLPMKSSVPLLTKKEIRAEQKSICKAAQKCNDLASDLLEEATALADYRDDRIKTAETKATSLMGAVAIAASLVVAGGGLILDSSKVADVWRQVLIVTVLALLFSLLMCGYLSSRALLTVRTIRGPQTRQALRRAKTGDAISARVDRALDLIERSNHNRYVADFKVAQNEAAHRWYKLALGLFVVLGALLVAYVLFGNIPVPTS
jgi:hypothetical protein